MGLFDKKYCDVCGEKIGLLGNRKLEDGNLCKNCAAKLSPWFSDRRHSTLAEIKDQLAWREENKEAVAAFSATKTLGDRVKVYIDETAGRFCVTSGRVNADNNPDILDLSCITGADLDVDEMKTELKQKGPDGKEVSYNPKRWSTEYDYHVVIRVNTPYYDEIRFRLNSSNVPGSSIMETMKWKRMGEDIVKALTAAPKEAARKAAEEAAAAAAAAKPVICPYCGATTTPDAKGCCEYCGSPVRT